MTRKVVTDTNVLVSALVWRGNPRKLLDEGLAGGWQFYTSPALLAELERVLAYPRLSSAVDRKGQTPGALRDLAHGFLRSAHSPPLPAPVCRDPDDDAILACALAARADLIVSGDADVTLSRTAAQL